MISYISNLRIFSVETKDLCSSYAKWPNSRRSTRWSAWTHMSPRYSWLMMPETFLWGRVSILLVIFRLSFMGLGDVRFVLFVCCKKKRAVWGPWWRLGWHEGERRRGCQWELWWTGCDGGRRPCYLYQRHYPSNAERAEGVEAGTATLAGKNKHKMMACEHQKSRISTRVRNVYRDRFRWKPTGMRRREKRGA